MGSMERIVKYQLQDLVEMVFNGNCGFLLALRVLVCIITW